MGHAARRGLESKLRTGQPRQSAVLGLVPSKPGEPVALVPPLEEPCLLHVRWPCPPGLFLESFSHITPGKVPCASTAQDIRRLFGPRDSIE